MSYAMPAAAVLAVGGLLACFAGYRLFRFVLGMLRAHPRRDGHDIVDGRLKHVGTLVLAAAVGGILGALLMIAAYFVGVGLIGAALAALALNLGWRFLGGEPPTLVLVIALRAWRPRGPFRRPLCRHRGHGHRRLRDAHRRCRNDTGRSRRASRCLGWERLGVLPARSDSRIAWWYPVIWVALAVVGICRATRDDEQGAGRRKRSARSEQRALSRQHTF